MSVLYPIIEYSVYIYKKEVFAGLNHDYSSVSQFFLTDKKVNEICFCWCLFLILFIRSWPIPISALLFSQNSWGLTLTSDQETFFFFFSCTGKKCELLLFNLVGLKWEWNLDYSNFSWIRSRMTTELEILLVQLLVASELEKAVITVLIRNDSNINEPT